MGETMLASEMTDGQIDDLANKLRDAARKHRDEIAKDSAQQGLRSDNVGMMLFAAFKRLCEELSRQIVHIVKVDRSRTPQPALDACGRKQYVDKDVVAMMPQRSMEKAKLVYFKPDPSVYKNGVISCADLAEEYKKRGLIADPQAQIDDNAANPGFADDTPNGCQWVDEHGNYCCATFSRWNVGRDVSVFRSDDGWNAFWSFAGVPEVSSAT